MKARAGILTVVTIPSLACGSHSALDPKSTGDSAGRQGDVFHDIACFSTIQYGRDLVGMPDKVIMCQ